MFLNSKRAKLLGTIIFLTGVVVTFQQCSMGGDSGGGFSNLPSRSGPTNLEASFDSATWTLNSTATNSVITGSCSAGNFTNHLFEFSYLENGASSSSVFRYSNAKCLSGDFTVTMNYSDLQIRPGFNGVLGVKLVGIKVSGEEAESPLANSNIVWSSGSTGSSTGGTTSPPPGCSTLQTGKSCNCGNYGASNENTAADCQAHCDLNGSKCCEWNQNSKACYYYNINTTSCSLQNSPSEWHGALCNN